MVQKIHVTSQTGQFPQMKNTHTATEIATQRTNNPLFTIMGIKLQRVRGRVFNNDHM